MKWLILVLGIAANASASVPYQDRHYTAPAAAGAKQSARRHRQLALLAWARPVRRRIPALCHRPHTPAVERCASCADVRCHRHGRRPVGRNVS